MKPKTVRRKRRNLRAITHRKPSGSYVKMMNGLADEILADCQRLFDRCSGCDTAVRDTASTGLAYLLHVAYDCRACALGIENEDFSTFIAAGVAQWLRDREYTEWFCIAASRLFSTSDPRRLVREEMVTIFRGKKKA